MKKVFFVNLLLIVNFVYAQPEFNRKLYMGEIRKTIDDIIYLDDKFLNIHRTKNPGTVSIELRSLDGSLLRTLTKEEFSEDLTSDDAFKDRRKLLIHIHTLMDKVDELHLQITVEGWEVYGNKIKYIDYWKIIPQYATLEPKLDPFYYYSEKGFFNFAASGLGDYSLYSYKFEVEGKDVYSDSGRPIVILDGLTNKLEYLNKTITIKGFYHGREFRYYNPTTKNIETSIWSVLVKAPPSTSMQYYGPWADVSLEKNRIVLNMEGESEFKKFRFSYIVKKNNSYLIIPPTIDNLTVRSDPADFLGISRSYLNDIWSVIEIEPDATFLQKLTPLTNVTLIIEFTDQFNIKHTMRLKTTIYYL
jgi:hypothetical protein